MSDGKVKCPKCGSTETEAATRGWNVWTGFLGSWTIVITCLKCGHKFKPEDSQ